MRTSGSPRNFREQRAKLAHCLLRSAARYTRTMVASICSKYRIGLPALLLAYAVLSMWLGWTEAINSVIEQFRHQEAAAKNRPHELPNPAVVFQRP
jgi:hypothetical protein